MFDVACRPMGRLFYWLLPLVLVSAWLPAQTPALTTITDVVYRADGTPAGGTLLISWPEFSTAAGQAVAAGKNSVVLGAGGALSVQLVPNIGATPAGTFYTVVYQLNDNTVKSEFWTVSTASPTTIAAIRATPGSTPVLSQFATQQYVNAATAPKANDSAVVHLAGSETITGVKQFSAAPTLPTPVHTTDAANKAYVDSSVANVGSGAFVPLAGGTMSGPLTLPSDPVATNQASNKHYVDTGLAAKAGLTGGLVPTSQLGSGTANNTLCLHGDSSWGGCGTSSNAVSIQGVPVVTTAPTANQVLTYNSSLGEYALNESDSTFSPQGLLLEPASTVINDVTIIGNEEPQAYVSDYFVGDGLTERFYLSQTPFTKISTTLFDEEYLTSPLEATLWSVVDPAGAVSVSVGKLQIAGGTGGDGATTVEFVEKIEMGGAMVLQHGDVMFTAASTGVLGGLYPGTISIAGCLAGFLVTPNGTQSNLQALVSGAPSGTAITTVAGHHYVLTTRLYSLELYRRQQLFHSSIHPAGSGRGGAEIAADVRVVLEIHDIDPANPASQVAASIVLFDGVISGAPDFCNYALVNAANLQCAIAFSRLIQAVDAEVRTALPGQSYLTRLVGTLSGGDECSLTSSGLGFFSSYVPATNQLIVVRYRGSGRALARVTNPASIVAEQQGADNGVHGAVRHVKYPQARTAVDCENAALALLDDATTAAWSGTYETWSDFLPGNAADIFPGDALNINIPSRGAVFQAIVREVNVSVKDLAGEHCVYQIRFANDAAETLSVEFQTAQLTTSLDALEMTDSQVGTLFLADLTAAAVTQVTSTTISLDAGATLPTGGGVEVRWSDQGWGPDNDRNLVGQFGTQIFTVPRLTRVQTYFLRPYDGSVPPKYSRYSASLHVDYPL